MNKIARLIINSICFRVQSARVGKAEIEGLYIRALNNMLVSIKMNNLKYIILFSSMLIGCSDSIKQKKVDKCLENGIAI